MSEDTKLAPNEWAGTFYDRYTVKQARSLLQQGRKSKDGDFVVHPRRSVKFAEARKENIMKYEVAMNSVPIISASIWLTARMCTAYGFTYKHDVNRELKPKEEKQLEFLRYWARFVNLEDIMTKIAACMMVYGDAFIEKVYDEKAYQQGGWGVKGLRIVHPDTVSVVRDEYGNIAEYIQEPYKLQDQTGIFTGPSGRGTRTGNSSGSDPQRRVAPPQRIVHFKLNDMTNAAYGTSIIRPLQDAVNITLGLEDDIADIIRTTARPLTVWLMGDAENPLSVKHMQAIASNIMSGLAQGSDIMVDGRVDVKVVESGKNITYIEPFMQYEVRQIVAALGVPDILFGFGSSSSEEATIKAENFRRTIMYYQKYIIGKIVNEVFRDIFLFSPSDFVNKKDAKRVIDGVTPDMYMQLPIIRPNEIEEISNRRLRIESEIMGGSMDLLEAKDEFGRTMDINEEALHPQLRMQLAQAEYYKSQSKAAEAGIEIQKEANEIQRESVKVQKMKPSQTSSE